MSEAASSQSAESSHRRGMRCLECGGALQVGRDLQLLCCAHCATMQLQTEEAGIEALAPVGRLGRRRIAAALRRALQERGIRGHVVREIQLRWLPFWQIEGQLVAWTRYWLKIAPVEGELPVGPSGEELREETLARPLQFSFPACDTRGVALLGVAFRFEGRKLRRLEFDAANPEAVVSAVLAPPSVALRRAEDSGRKALLPRQALRPLLRSSLLRTRVRLIYYPIYRIDYEAHGRPHHVIFDGLNAAALGGTLPRLGRSHACGWLASAAVAGWVVAWHPVLALLSWVAWAWHRLRQRDGVALGWAAWWSDELAASHLRTEMAQSRGEEA